jgi:hypothetical protein
LKLAGGALKPQRSVRMKTVKGRNKTCLAGVFGIVLALVPVLSACGQSISGRYTGESEHTLSPDSGFMSFEFDGSIVKVMRGRNDELAAATYKINGKHISIEIPLSPLILEIKDGNTLEGIGSPINGIHFFKSSSDFDYSETNEGGKRGITITNYTGTNSVVTIPAKIRNLPVTAIGEYAFSGKHLTGVTFPKSVTTIGYMAFATNQLTSVTIPDSVTTIGGYVFMENQLASVTIPDSVTTIGSAAFSNNQLTSITIPDSVTTITDYTFSENQLDSITIGNNVKIKNGHFGNNFTQYYDETGKRAGIYTLVNNRWRFTLHNEQDIKTSGDFEYKENNIGGKRGITITHYVGTNPALTIPAKINNLPVTAIGASAFIPFLDWFDSEADFIERVGKAPIKVALTSVTIPDSVTTIGNFAFEGNHLTSVTIPDSVITIGFLAFTNNQLISITIPDNVTTIVDGAFQMNQLTSVTIPDSVTTIGDYAFGQNQLTSIAIGNNVNIDSAFDNNFEQYYDRSGKKAGTYTFANGRWSAVYRQGEENMIMKETGNED